MKKTIVVVLGTVIVGTGIAGIGLAAAGSLARQNAELADRIDAAAARSVAPGFKQADKFRAMDLPLLLEALSSDDGAFEKTYLRIYGELPGTVQTWLPDVYPSAALRLNAAAVIGRWGPAAKDAIPQLIRLLHDDVADSNAALSLGLMGLSAQEAIPALTIAVEEQRPFAATALGRMGSAAKAARPILQLAAENGPVWLHREVARALENIGEDLSARN